MGEKGNVVYELASKLNLTKKSVVTADDYFFIRTNGEIFDKEVGLQQLAYFYNITGGDEFKNHPGSMGQLISKR
jgi:hypothetical protein